jgi:DNA-binding Xre family transcriptional regulator
MIMAQLRNRVPEILKARDLSISDLQRMTGLSYPAVHNMARAVEVSDQTRVGTLRKISEALDVPIGELVAEN